MDSAAKTKVILFSSLGILILVVVALFVSTGENEKDQEQFNTSIRRQMKSDFTLEEMMKAGENDAQDYENPIFPGESSEEYFHENEEAEPEINTDTIITKVITQVRPKVRKPEKIAPEDIPVQNPQDRFFSGNEKQNIGNTTEAIVAGDQQIMSGSVIKLIILQDMKLDNGVNLPRGTAVFGVVKIDQDRININIQSVRVGNSIYDLKKMAYDRDGLPGIYVPLNLKAEASKEATEEIVNDINVGSYSGDLVTTGMNAVSNAAKSVFRKKNNQIVVTVKANYKLYLK